MNKMVCARCGGSGKVPCMGHYAPPGGKCKKCNNTFRQTCPVCRGTGQ